VTERMLGTYYVWQRDMKLWVRQKWIALITFFGPMLTVLVFSVAMSSALQGVNLEGYTQISYITFFSPGFVVVWTFTISLINAMSVFLDRETGAMEDILVSPLNRRDLYLGKVLATTTKSFLITVLLLFASVVVGAEYNYSPMLFLQTILVLVVASLAFSSLAVTLTSKIKETGTYNAMVNVFAIIAIMFTNAYYPLESLPHWIRIVAYINPVTYINNIIRSTLVLDTQPSSVDLMALTAFTVIFLALGIIAYRKMRK
jgi:ABC-2 type transport system permease protein